MPFVAMETATHARVDITEIVGPRDTLAGRIFVCPYCPSSMIVKAGLLVRPHFAHRQGCTSLYGPVWHRESAAHLRAKALAKTWILEELSAMDATAHLEYPLPSLKRIADCMAILPDKRMFAIEIQLASLTTEALALRTADYRALGIPVMWWLGKAANTPANRHWCRRELPDYGQLTFDDTTPTLHRFLTKPFDCAPFFLYHSTPFACCPGCEQTVIVRTWQHGKGWTPTSTALDPTFGMPHTCKVPIVRAEGSPL